MKGDITPLLSSVDLCLTKPVSGSQTKSSGAVQLLLMNNGVHFSTFPVASTAEIQQICETQLSGDVGHLQRYVLLSAASATSHTAEKSR